ncbi:MAG: hypothetical protein IPM79_25630 [Polyangiaceae bacterium]|nr:hypothetical protein [Polyangiaceae bacterium]
MARPNTLRDCLTVFGVTLFAVAALGCADDTTASGGAGAGGGASAGGGDEGGASQGGGAEGGQGAGDPVIPGEHPRIYLNDAERARLSTALAAPTAAADRYKAYVDAALEGNTPYDFQGWHAALVYALTGDDAYADLAIAHVDAMVAEDEALVAAGSSPLVAADSYLEVGPRVGDMAMVFDWCFDRVTDEQRTRWIAWGNQAVFNVWHHEEASWSGQPMPWSGWAVDDPVNNYYFSFLRATMLLGLATYAENPEAPLHLDFFRQTKIDGQLLEVYAALGGGGSREGTGYGVAMANLFRIYDVWEKSTGEDLAGLTDHARGSIAHMLHSMAPTLDRIAPIGDHARDSTAALFDYHRDYLLVLGALYPSDPASLVARTALSASSVPEASQGFMRFSDFLYEPAGLETAPLSSLYPAYHAEGVGHVFVRSSWEQDATWASFIAGPYDQSHAHHDQGSLTIFKDEWLAYDANIDSQSGIRLEEKLHNLVRIESQGSVARMVEGAPPSTLLALQDEPSATFFAADLTSAYGGAALVTSVRREVVFVKPSFFVVRDRVGTSAPSAQRVFQLNTPLQPSVSSGRASIDGAASSLDLFVVRPAAVTPSVVDWDATDGDMNGGYRIEVATSGQEEALFLTVLSIDGEVASATASGAAGVTIAAASGDFTVSFSEEGVGATVESASGTTTFTAAVDQLPLLAE